MDSFPAYFPLAGRKVVIAGEGEGAEAKARLLESSPAQVVRLADVRAFDAAFYQGAVLAFVASADEAFAIQAVRAARDAGVPVNAVDRPALCDFISPAVIDRGAVVAAVGASGAPMLATQLRQDIEARVPEGAGRVAALLHQFQGEVRQLIPDFPQRRAFLRRILAGPAAEAAMKGDMEAARRLFREALAAGGEAAAGKVSILVASGPADLITLRAHRALASAEVIVADEGVDPDVLALARREAQRRPADASPEALAALAREGLTVVRVTTASPSDADIEALRRAGAIAEVLPVASGD